MRKFVIIPIFVILCAVTICYTAFVYFQIKTTQNTLYSELQKTFFTQADTLIQIFSEREAQANALAKITDPDQLKKAVIGNILTLSVFDPQMHFLYGLNNSLPSFISLTKTAAPFFFKKMALCTPVWRAPRTATLFPSKFIFTSISMC